MSQPYLPGLALMAFLPLLAGPLYGYVFGRFNLSDALFNDLWSTMLLAFPISSWLGFIGFFTVLTDTENSPVSLVFFGVGLVYAAFVFVITCASAEIGNQRRARLEWQNYQSHVNCGHNDVFTRMCDLKKTLTT